MGQRQINVSIGSRDSCSTDSLNTVYCKLFADRVTLHLCILRRKELNAKGGFSCEGCSMEREAARQADCEKLCLGQRLASG